MSGVKRITTTERLEFCRACRDECDEIVPADFILWGKLLPPEHLGPRCYGHTADALGQGMGQVDQYAVFDLRRVAVAADERVRVVEGLVATIKALPRPPASRRFGLIHAERLDEYRDAVLAVVEAARGEVSREAVAGRGDTP